MAVPSRLVWVWANSLSTSSTKMRMLRSGFSSSAAHALTHCLPNESPIYPAADMLFASICWKSRPDVFANVLSKCDLPEAVGPTISAEPTLGSERASMPCSWMMRDRAHAASANVHSQSTASSWPMTVFFTSAAISARPLSFPPYMHRPFLCASGFVSQS